LSTPPQLFGQEVVLLCQSIFLKGYTIALTLRKK